MSWGSYADAGRHSDSLDRPHDDDGCICCEDCGHWQCDHYAYDHPLEGDDECLVAGCDCPMTWADGGPVQTVVAS